MKFNLFKTVFAVNGILVCTFCIGTETTQIDERRFLNQEEIENFSELERIESRFAANEFEEVVKLSSELIDQIAEKNSRYDVALIEPLVLLGDSSRKVGNYVDALDAYERARHITRLTHGLQALEQVDVVYREADTYLELGQLGRANDRHEYAYTMFARRYDTYSPELLPGLFTLADWYVDTQNIFAARGLFEYATQITDRHFPRVHQDNIRALKGLARTYRLERFRPPSPLGQIEQPIPKLYWTNERPYVYYAEVNSFAPGESALIELVNIERDREDSSQESIAEAKLELADWFLLFDKYQRAQVVYEDVLNMFENDPDSEFLKREFSVPVSLYNPLPKDPEPLPQGFQAMPHKGTIELMFSVTKEGNIRNLRVVNEEPDDRYTQLFKNAARYARYRPVFQDGEVQAIEEVSLKHDYIYYLDRENVEKIDL